MESRHTAKQAVIQAVGANNVGPYVGDIAGSHVYVVAPSKRAIVSANKVAVYDPKGGVEEFERQ